MKRCGSIWNVIQNMRCAMACVAAVAVACAGASVTTAMPGWTFTDADTPVFNLTNCGRRIYWALEDWRGKPIRSGTWPRDGNLVFAPLPPGYYHVKCSDAARLTPESFTFCVTTTNRCRNLDSIFAADAGLSGCSRRGAYDCPWYGGNCWHVTAELLGKCGLVHTRERLGWSTCFRHADERRVFFRV